MKKLSKKQEAEFQSRLDDIQEKQEAVDKAHQGMQKTVEDYNEEVRGYNELVQNLMDYRDELVADMQCYFDDRSERWQEGEAGQNYQSWMSDWETLEVECMLEEAECPPDPSSEFFAQDFCYEPEPCG